MRPNSRVREPGGTGVRRLRAVLPIVLGLLTLAACATTVAGTAAPAVTVLPSAPSPVPPSPVAPSTVAASTTGSPRTASPITQPSVTTAASSTGTASDPSTEILTVVSTTAATSARTSTPASTSAATTVSRLTVPPSSDHHGTAEVTDDGILVAHGTAKVGIEIYAEPLCPPCAAFAERSGAEIDNAIDNGELVVTYRTLTFLDSASASGTYSTRASAALFCVADRAGSQPGLFQDFYATLFDPAHQPEENGSKDLTDAQLVALAAGVAAPESVRTCIRDGAELSTAKDADAAGRKALAKAGAAGTPAVAEDGKLVDHESADWLDDVLAGG